MKNFLRIAVAVLLLAAVPQFANAQTKGSPSAVAHINLDSLLQIMPEVQKANDSAEMYMAMLEKQLYTMSLELDRKLNEYDSLNKMWSPLIKSLKEKEIRDLQENIQAFQQTAQNDFTNYRAGLYQPIFKKIENAVKDVAVARGYKYVLDSSKSAAVVLYANPGDDIFNDVRIKLNIPLPAPKTGGATGGGAPAPAPGR
jgi:outer membrane protein